MRLFIYCFLAAAIPAAAADANALLWHAPAEITVSEFTWGPGGESHAPKPPFQFLEEDLAGTNPKLKVSDALGQKWTVKFGGEIHSEVFAARLLFALGYEAQPSYFVRSGVITGAHGLKRAKPFIGKNGEFAYARFKLHQSKKSSRVDGMDWSWTSNPFVGTRELNGLKVLMMLVSNWDAKDSRDRKGSNTAVYSDSGNQLYYAFDDWGATFGKWGGFFSRDKWDADGYRAQSQRFIRGADGETIRWGYIGKHGKDLTRGIRVVDVRWLLTYLSPVTNDELRAGLRASGATPGNIEIYVQSIRDRITQLEKLTGAGTATR